MVAAAAAQEDMPHYLASVEDGYTVGGSSSDPEVTLRPRRWSAAESINFDDDTLRSGRSEKDPDVRLTAVESAVRDINDKFDRLLSFMPIDAVDHTPRGGPSQTYDQRWGQADLQADTRSCRHPPPTPHTAPYNSRPGREEMDHYNRPPPPPNFPSRDSMRGPGYDAYVEEQIRREDFLATRADDGKGIASDILTKHLLPKPYMYISKPGVSTIRKKLEARESMSFVEYICAYIKMIRDPRAN